MHRGGNRNKRNSDIHRGRQRNNKNYRNPMSDKEDQKIELRSEEVQDILGHVPAWIVRWGILVILLTIILIIVGSWFFRYPDIKRANVIITTENPPATIIARTNGKIQKLFVQDNQNVTAETRLAIIESAADYRDVLLLDEITTEIRHIIPNFDMLVTLDLSADYTLGDIQPAYANFLKTHKDYQNFIQLNYHEQKINALKSEVGKLEQHLKNLQQIRSLHKRELDLIQIQYNRDSTLLRQGAIAPAEFDKSKANLLGKQYEFEQVKNDESLTDIQIAKRNQDILDLELTASEETIKQQNSWQESFENLVSQISQWKQNYLLEAPIDGVVSFTAYWSENQNVREGDRVMTIIPANQGKIIGKINLPIHGAGKVAVNQQVNIKIDNFPYLEYGMVKGIVRNISLVPDNKEYAVEVDLPDGLTTYYKKEIPFNQEMQGTAEILTDQRRLLERIISPIRTIITQQRSRS
jgi:multidrug resistance efflux pump